MGFSSNYGSEIYGLDPETYLKTSYSEEIEALREDMEEIHEELETVKNCLLKIFSRLED